MALPLSGYRGRRSGPWWVAVFLVSWVASAFGSGGPTGQSPPDEALVAACIGLLDHASPGTQGLSDDDLRPDWGRIGWPVPLEDDPVEQPVMPRAGLTMLLETLAEGPDDAFFKPKPVGAVKAIDPGARGRWTPQTRVALTARSLLAKMSPIPSVAVDQGAGRELVALIELEPTGLLVNKRMRPRLPAGLVAADHSRAKAGSLPTPLGSAVRCSIETYSADLMNATGWFRVTIEVDADAARLAPLARQVVFVVLLPEKDRGTWIGPLANSLGVALGNLHNGDRFNVARYDNGLMLLGVDAIAINDRTVQKARQFLTGTSTNQPAPTTTIRELFAPDARSERARSIVLISPTINGNPGLNAGDFRVGVPGLNTYPPTVHYLGLGAGSQAGGLMGFIADQHRGRTVYASDPDGLPAAMDRLMQALRGPVLDRTRVVVQGPTVDEIYPSRIGTLRGGQQVAVYGRFKQPGRVMVWITGQNRSEMADAVLGFEILDAERGTQQIKHQWALHKMHDMWERLHLAADPDAARAALDEHCRRYGLPVYE